MTTTVCITGYKYEELSEKAQERVKEWINSDMHLWDKYTEEMWLEQWGALGYEGIDFRYSGFHSQGDGASIACTVNIQQFIKRNKLGRKFARLLYWVRQVFDDGGAVDIRRRVWGHYVHDNLLYANNDDLLYDLHWGLDWAGKHGIEDAVIAQAEELAPLILQEVREKSVEIYKWLEADYEYRYTDECVKENCEANEYLFNEYGAAVHHLALAE